MKPVLILSPNSRSELLRKTFLEKKLSMPLLIRMGSLSTKIQNSYPVQVNSLDATYNSADKLTMKKHLTRLGLHTLGYVTSMDSISLPMVIKGRYKNEDRPSTYYVDNKTDLLLAIGLVKKRYYCEPVFKATSEYRLYCNQNEVFLTIKKCKIDNEDVILSKHNSNNLRLVKGGSIKFPKLWTSIQKEALVAVKCLGLDIASVDIGYSSEGDHRFVIYKVNPNPPLPPNIFSMFVEQVEGLIKNKM